MSPFRPFGNFVVLAPIELEVKPIDDTNISEEKPSEEKPDGRMRNPWGTVLSVGPHCEFAKEGEKVFYFYAEEIEHEGVKYHVARETDLFVALK